jgi:hypothetical protein
MTQPAPRGIANATGSAARWETVRYAFDSTSRTARLCAILAVTGLPTPVVIFLLVHR